MIGIGSIRMGTSLRRNCDWLRQGKERGGKGYCSAMNSVGVGGIGLIPRGFISKFSPGDYTRANDSKSSFSPYFKTIL